MGQRSDQELRTSRLEAKARRPEPATVGRPADGIPLRGDDGGVYVLKVVGGAVTLERVR